MHATRLCTILLTSFFFSATAAAQVFDSGPSDPTLFTEVFNLPGDEVPNRVGGVIDQTTQVNFGFGYSERANFFASAGSEVNVDGGSVESRLYVRAGSEVNVIRGSVGPVEATDSEVNISGGSVGNGFDARDGSEINIRGGSVGFLRAFGGSKVNISGGSVENGLEARFDSEVNISGGSVRSSFRAQDGSVVNISGGSVGGNFNARDGSAVHLFGSNFAIDGVLLDNLIAGEAFTIRDRNVTLSGLFADGSAFSIDLEDNLAFAVFLNYFSHSSTLTVTLGSPLMIGDFDSDGDVDGDDVDFYIGNLDQPATGDLTQLDLNGDGDVTIADHDLHVTTMVVTSNGVTGALLGDVNLDGSASVLSDAFVIVGSLGQSVTSRSQGDLNADGMVDVLDDAFILIGQLGQSNGP